MLLDELFNDQAFLPVFGERVEIGLGREFWASKSPVAEGKHPNQQVVNAIQKMLPVAQEIWFHGSRATGQHRRNSDTDILVVVPDDLVGDQYLGAVRKLQKLSSHFDNYDIQPTKAGTNIHSIAQEEGRLLWSNKQGVAEGQLKTDVPNEKWLAGKQEYARKRGRNSFGVPYMGSTTAYVRQPSHVMLPVSLLSRIPGARGEQKNVRYDDLEAIMKIMKDTGKLPLDSSGEEYMPFITVAWNGEPWVSEGNHRIMAAKRLGWNTLPVELKYFDGGERVESGLLYPGKIGLSEPDQLEELSFLGSQCTRDCSGHRAGYEWYKRKQRPPMSWSPSFNKGAALAQAGK